MRMTRLSPLLAALLGAASIAAQAVPLPGVIELAPNLRADVIWSNNTGATLYSEVKDVPGLISVPKQSAEILYVQPLLGANVSSRAVGVNNAFASALAESDGNGGVGIDAFKFSPAQGVGGYDQLVSQASWEQTFDYVGAQSATISVHLAIPEVTVGLLGVSPQRSAVNKIETSLAQVNLTTVIQRADGSIDAGGTFEYGMHADEYQILLGPNTYANFADVTFIADVGNKLSFNGNDYLPAWTLDAISKDVTLGTLGPGDSLTYTYQLTTRGRTNGAERGFLAFIGDPFGVNITEGNLAPTITFASVPEPPTWTLLLAGLYGAVWFARRRGASAA